LDRTDTSERRGTIVKQLNKSIKMECQICGQEIEYDEGEGNNADGYICFQCINDEKYGDLKNE